MAEKTRHQVALITGASGGIGSAIARQLAREGCRLALHYCSNRAGIKHLQNELGNRGKIFRADLLKPQAPQKLWEGCLNFFGGIDILVNNAGAIIGQEDFTVLTEEDWDKTFRLNTIVPFLLSQAAFVSMKKYGGRIINISSVAAKYGGSPKSLHYGAAKAALENLTLSFSKQGAAYNILVNTVRAGVIDTPLHKKFEKNMSARIELIPLRRMGKPEDVARLVSLLAGPGGNFITGQVLSVTGGE